MFGRGFLGLYFDVLAVVVRLYVGVAMVALMARGVVAGFVMVHAVHTVVIARARFRLQGKLL